MAAFLEKHKLSKDYASYKEVEKTYSSSREATKQTVGEQISTQMDKIDSSIKATAKQSSLFSDMVEPTEKIMILQQ